MVHPFDNILGSILSCLTPAFANLLARVDTRRLERVLLPTVSSSSSDDEMTLLNPAPLPAAAACSSPRPEPIPHNREPASQDSSVVGVLEWRHNIDAEVDFTTSEIVGDWEVGPVLGEGSFGTYTPISPLTSTAG